MSLASLVPSIVIDPFHTPMLLPPSVMETMVLPYCEEYTGVATNRTDCPPWNAELEAYHQLVHPIAWANMGVDDVADAAALKALIMRIAALEDWTAPPVSENDSSLDDLETAHKIIRRRREYRWSSLLGIHVARTRYIEHQLRTTSASSASEVLAALPGQGAFTPPAAEPHSLWPIFALPPPPLDASQLVTLWNCEDWSRFIFPAPPSDAFTAAAFSTDNDSGDTSLAAKPGLSAVNAVWENTAPIAPAVSIPTHNELRQRRPQKAQSVSTS